MQSATIRNPILTNILTYLYAFFLLSTGIMTIYFWLGEVNFTKDTSQSTDRFMKSIADSHYIIPWLGIFKTVVGAMMFFKSTVKVAILMALPYVVNILLYVFFISYQDYLVVGLFDGIICFYLLYAYWPFYKPLFRK